MSPDFQRSEHSFCPSLLVSVIYVVRLSTSDWVSIAGAVLVVIILCCWCIDVSVSALINGGVLMNAFTFANPGVMYHLALYVVLGLSFFMFMLMVHILTKEKKN